MGSSALNLNDHRRIRAQVVRNATLALMNLVIATAAALFSASPALLSLAYAGAAVVAPIATNDVVMLRRLGTLQALSSAGSTAIALSPWKPAMRCLGYAASIGAMGAAQLGYAHATAVNTSFAAAFGLLALACVIGAARATQYALSAASGTSAGGHATRLLAGISVLTPRQAIRAAVLVDGRVCEVVEDELDDRRSRQ